MSDFLSLPSIPDPETLGLARRGAGVEDRLLRADNGPGIREAAREFESFFLSYLLQVMRRTVPETGLLGPGRAEKIYRSLLDEEIARSVADRGGIGLGDWVARGLEEEIRRRGGGGHRSGADEILAYRVAGPQARVTSGFGPRRDPVTGRPALHHGIDIALKPGTAVRAAAAGTVVFSGPAHGYGNVVIVDHGRGIQTLYAHNRANRVGPGRKVRAGEVVGYAGASGRATGPHLHLEVRERGRSVDPANFLKILDAGGGRGRP